MTRCAPSILTGAGGDFCAGADWVATNSDGSRPRTGDLTRRIPHANRLVELIASIQLPVVCSVQGWACLASAATSRWPPISPWPPPTQRCGSASSTGGSAPTPARPGCCPRLASRWPGQLACCCSARRSPAATPPKWELDPRRRQRQALGAATEELLARLAAGQTVAIGLAKRAISYGLTASLTQSMNHELTSLELSCRTIDFKEGLGAFREPVTGSELQGR